MAAKKTQKLQDKNSANSEARWQTIFENMKETVMTVNRKCVILSINHVLQGFTLEDVLGQSLFNFVTPDKADYIKSNVERMLKTSVSFEVEDYIQGRDGSDVWYYSVYNPVVGKDGKINEFIIIARDITLMKRVEHNVLNAIIEGQEEERRRVSGELHDGLGQNISAIRMGMLQLQTEVKLLNSANAEKTFANIQRLIGKASDEVKSISRNLAPPSLTDFGLKVVIKDYCLQMSRIYKLKTLVNVKGMEQRLNAGLETAVYRIVQELLNNVIKHAKASEVSISIENMATHLMLVVLDNGKGYNTALRSKGLGLHNINTRVKIHKGEVFVLSKKGKGTLVRVEIPIREGKL